MSEPAFSRFQKFASVLKDAVWLSTLIVGLSSAIASLAISWIWPLFIDRLQEDLNMATKGDLVLIQAQINKITGEDRIIRMPTGHSFISEPVSKGEPIDLTLVLGRTTHGESCNFVSATPLFTDNRGIPFAGSKIMPIKQLDQAAERLQLTLDVPDPVRPGRVGLSLAMSYNCPFGPGGQFMEAFDETDIIFFQMDPSPD